MDLALMLRSLPALLEGAWVTIQLVALALLAGFAVALPVALMRVSRRRWLRAPAFAYVFCFRGTPLLVQIYLAYYGLGQFEAIRQSAQILRHLAEALRRSVRHHHVDGAHDVHHVAVADGARAAGIVAGHAAQGRAAAG